MKSLIRDRCRPTETNRNIYHPPGTILMMLIIDDRIDPVRLCIHEEAIIEGIKNRHKDRV
jgi:hypothetical protein